MSARLRIPRMESTYGEKDGEEGLKAAGELGEKRGLDLW